MPFQLHVVDAAAGRAEVVLGDLDRELLDLQLARCVDRGGLELFAQWLSVALASALPSMVDYELRPPSEAQVNFAMAIVRALSVALPPQVLKHRGAMHDFLSTHKAAYDAHRKAQAAGTSGFGPGGSAPQNDVR